MRTGDFSHRYQGGFLATVVDVNDPEKQGRVRVQSPQFEDSLDHPIWVPVSRPGAGNGLGVFYTPKPGDQVHLTYLANDVDGPIISGYIHSSQNLPDPSLVGPQQHGIVTTIGSVVFDEENKIITITFAGPIPSVIQMTTDGIRIQGGGTIQIDAPNVIINNRPVAPQSRPI